jgi:hypothetical protein
MRHRVVLALALLGLAVPGLAAPSLSFLDSGQWTFNEDVAVQGTRIATTLAYGVQLWELDDPADPVMLGDYYTDGKRTRAVAWEGNLVAATIRSESYLYLFDVSDPAHPTRIDRLSGVGSSADLALVRDGATRWCYSAGSAGNDFQIRDLTNPAASVLHGGLNLPATPNALAVLGDIVLVSAASVGLYAVDVSNPDAPVLVDTEAVTGTHVGVAADGTRAALASGAAGFTLFDVTNPANPVKRATVSPAAGAWSNLSVSEVVIGGTMLYAICQDVGALAYDISNLNAPLLTGYDPRLDITPPAPPYYVFNEGVIVGDRLYLTEWNGFTPGCVVLDATSSDMAYLGRSLGFDYVRDVDEDGGFIYGCTGQMGIFAHQHVSPNQLVPRGQLHVVESWGVQAHGTTVYVASTTDGIVVGDFTDPDNPVRHDELDVGQARQLTVEDGVAYVVAFTQGFHTVDVSDWDHLVALDAVTRPNMQSVNLDKVGDLVVTADRADGMNLWNVADPANIQHISNWATPNQALDVVLSPDGAYAYLVVNGTGVQVLDVSPPATPVLLTTIAAGLGATGVVLDDGYLHVSVGTNGVRSYHQAASPAAPVLLAGFDTTHNSWSLCARTTAAAHYVYVADYSGIVALRFDTDTPVAVSSFALEWTGSGVLVDWQLGEPAAAEDLRLVAAPAAGGAEAEIDIAPLGAGGQAWQGFDSRAALVPGSEWRYTLSGREPGADWELLRSETIVIESAPLAAVALRAFPNPFNPSTRLDFVLPAASPARLAVFDVSGRRLATLHEGLLAAGPASFAWDGKDGEGRALPSGVYLARLELAGEAHQVKLVMLR